MKWRAVRHTFGSQKKCRTQLRFNGFLLCIIVLGCAAAFSQQGAAPATPAAAQPDIPQDVFGRHTPRGTLLGFLRAGQKGDDTATEYLNTRARGRAAAVLAHQLFVVLDRRLPVRFGQVSDKPEGSNSAGLRLDQELIGTINTANGNLDIVLERVKRGKSGSIWLFSSKTLESIPDAYDEISVVSVHDVLPPWLTDTRVAGIALFEWLALFVGLPLVYFLLAFLNRLLRRLAGIFRRRIYRNPDLSNPEILPTPIRLLVLAGIIRWLLSKVSLPLSARFFWSSVSATVIIAACLWLFLLFNNWAARYVCRHLRGRELSGTASIVRLGRRVVDILGVFAAFLVILHYFGVDPTAALAGLGVGGIAVALAAQKTLENVVGGVSLILDKAVRTGDTVKVGETVGTVEEIGLRSTRIRTSDRTVLIVPNGQIANMSLEALSSRDKYWFHPSVGLRYQTTSVQMSSVVEGIRTLLLEHASVDHSSVRVQFYRFGPSSLDIDVSAHVYARDWNLFLDVQEQLLLSIMKIVQQAGTQIALPSQTMYLASDSLDEAATRYQTSASGRRLSSEPVLTK